MRTLRACILVKPGVGIPVPFVYSHGAARKIRRLVFIALGYVV